MLPIGGRPLLIPRVDTELVRGAFAGYVHAGGWGSPLSAEVPAPYSCAVERWIWAWALWRQWEERMGPDPASPLEWAS